jgi:hypothetical protein
VLQIDPWAILTDTYGNAIRAKRERPMPRINDEVANASVFLYPSENDAEQGLAFGGSGFLVSMPSRRHPDRGQHIYIVTNRHVVEDFGSDTVRINRTEGLPPFIKKLTNWQFHPDGTDIAVHYAQAIGLTRPFFLRHVSTGMFITPDLIDKLNLGIGDEVFMMGRLVGYDGREVNVPSLRFGHVSAPLKTQSVPIQYEYGGVKRTANQDCFLVECRSLVGYSGSPVLIEITARTRVVYQNELKGYDSFLLGVNCAYPRHKVTVGTFSALIDSGMALVIPAWKVQEILDRSDLQRERDLEEKRHERPPLASPAASA